jgi:hypothetical protein
LEKLLSERISDSYEMLDFIAPPEFRLTRLPNGLGFGDGTISGAEIDSKSLSLLEETIDTDSPEFLIPVEADDDGCSDGRPAISVFTKERILKRSLVRPKIFGGAVTMTAASRIGLGLTGDEYLQEVFVQAVDTLTDKDIHFGAHTGEHAHGEDCGCGAIDKAPEALNAVIKYEDPIRSAITLLGVESEGLDEVFGNYRYYWTDVMSKAVPYKGSEVMGKIVDSNAVVKKLGGEHLERRIVLNSVRDFTVNQELIRLITGGRAQVFGVDVWRLQDVAARLYPDNAVDQQKAVLSELVYTLATAAVLTKGDLPIDIIEPASS